MLRALGLGDLLCAVPALRALGRAHPDHALQLAAPHGLTPLASLTGAVDQVVSAAPLRALPPRAADAALAANLHGSGPQSHRVLLATRPRRLIAFAHPAVAATRGLPAWRDDEHERVRWCRLLAESRIPADPGDLELDRTQALAAHGGAGLPQGATLLHPGAASAARRWPVERWAAVARSEAADGRRVVVTGGPAERPLAREVALRAGLGEDAVLAGRTDLGRLCAVVAAAERVVCGDTGVAHVATALRTPSVLLFGPTDPRTWGPPAERPWHRVLWAGRTGDPHGRRPDPGLLEIEVRDVRAALAALPDRYPSAPSAR